MGVERGLGGSGSRHDLIDADGVQPARVKKLVGGVEDAFTRFLWCAQKPLLAAVRLLDNEYPIHFAQLSLL